MSSVSRGDRTARLATTAATTTADPRPPRLATRRVIVLHPHHRLLAAARPFAATEAFTKPYKQHRPIVERSIAWLVRGSRRLRYRGTDHNQLWLGHRVAAINLQRLINLGLTHEPAGWAIT